MVGTDVSDNTQHIDHSIVHIIILCLFITIVQFSVLKMMFNYL